MKTLILSLLLTSPMGCGSGSVAAPQESPVAEVQNPAPAPDQGAAETSPAVEQVGGSKKGSADASGTVAASSDEEPPKHRNNPRRLFQLDDLKTVKIKIGKHTFNTWIMDSEDKRAEGMMWLEDQDFTDKDAMIFVYNEPMNNMSFWMRNTLVDLDIAFVAPNKTILNVETMKRLNETGVPAKGSAQYAIEFKARLLKKLGIKAGMKVEMPDLKSDDYR